MADNRESARVKDANRLKVMDEATRRRRDNKAMEILERDNYHEDPHANLVMSTKVPKFADSVAGTSKRRKVEKEPYKQKFAKNFESVLMEDQMRNYKEGKANYLTAAVPPSKYPAPHFCSVCGFPSTYVCSQCGTRFCSIKCKQIHQGTRCMKWVA